MNNFKINIFKTRTAESYIYQLTSISSSIQDALCGSLDFPFALYSSSSTPFIGMELFTDINLTIIFNGAGNWYGKTADTNWQISSLGILQTIYTCTVPVTDVLSLGYATTTGPDACADEPISPVNRYVPIGDLFLVTTVLYQNAAGTIPAQAGYYSDGAKWRYWDEVSFTSEGFC